MRIFCLVTDAYGGHGGIALFNRDLLESLCCQSDVVEVIALPRVISRALEPMPSKLVYRSGAARGAWAYALALIGELPNIASCDVIYCAHVNLAPIAWLLGRFFRVPVLLALYGIEAWQPTGRWITDKVVPRMKLYYAISNFTKSRFIGWSGVNPEHVRLLPNAIHLELYGTGIRSPTLQMRLGIQNRTVLLTLGRIVSRERAKGFDEVIGILDALRTEIPDIVYVIAGDGDYRSALEEKVERLGLRRHVVFAGFIAENDKADLYRCADVYVMPSRGEGFGFVFLEAMACGVPVVASALDGSRDAVLDGKLGLIAHPDDPAALKGAILAALKAPRIVPDGLQHFSYCNFTKRVHSLIDDVCAQPEQTA